VVTGSVAQRREAKMAGIVACAWALAREHGIAGVSLHALAREVGIRQPSLYEYSANSASPVSPT
jgi:AcrR family transcriptional regulator